MGPEAIIPAADPMPLPAPFWLFKLLLMVTFVLHILAMNFMLGGGVLATLARFRSGKSENHHRLSVDIGRKIPAFLAAAITIGVAPLLFVQVLYGQFFYTSSVIIAWPWFLVLVLLTAAYYTFYIVTFNTERRSRSLALVMLLSVVLVFLVGFIYSNNFTLLQTPEKWSAKYHADPSGWNLNWSEATLIPRFLHFFVASVAVGGLMILITGLIRWNKDQEYARFLIRNGGKGFMYATMAQFAVGIWFLVRLPQDKMLVFMGGNTLATLAFLIGVLGGLAAIFIMSGSLRDEDPRRGAVIAASLAGGVVVFMSIMRDALRGAYLSPYFQPGDLAVKTQWDVLGLFLILFVGGLLVWGWMLRKYVRAPAVSAVR